MGCVRAIPAIQALASRGAGKMSEQFIHEILRFLGQILALLLVAFLFLEWLKHQK